MSKTGTQLLAGYSTFLDDYFASTTTSAGTSTGTTIADTKLEKWGDNRLIGWYIRITSLGAATQVSRIVNNAQATGTVEVAPPFTIQIASGTTYELHQFEPVAKFATLDAARLAVSNDVFQLKVDETITTNSYSREYTIPTSIERGPSQVYIEIPQSPVANWNFIPNPDATTNMTGWTATNVTTALYASNDQDLYIPKRGTSAVKCSVAAAVAGTLTLTVGSMANSITAAKAAGRNMTFAAWIFSKDVDLTLSITDDSGVAGTSSAHQGLGWELMSVEVATISPTNTTTLTLKISDTGSSGITFYIGDMWFYYGPYTQLNSQFYGGIPLRISKDDTRKRFVINENVPPRRQLRVVGKAALSALGTDLATQLTNTMEVDNGTAEIVYAKAAEILFEQQKITTANMKQVAQRISYVKDRTPDLRMNWDQDIEPQRFYGPYSGGFNGNRTTV